MVRRIAVQNRWRGCSRCNGMGHAHRFASSRQRQSTSAHTSVILTLPRCCFAADYMIMCMSVDDRERYQSSRPRESSKDEQAYFGE